MSVPAQYLTSTKNLKDILDAIRDAKAPERFTLSFLEGLGYKSSSDRLVIGVLKALGFLDADGRPAQRYYEFLDKDRSGEVMAEALELAYADVYQVNRRAHELSPKELKNKLKTITQGEYSEDVLGKMANTFKALAAHANFSQVERREKPISREEDDRDSGGEQPSRVRLPEQSEPGVARLGGLVYNIQLVLPESRDVAVYDALFRSLREHLL